MIVVAGGFTAALVFGLRTDGGALLLPLTAAQLLWINLVTDGAPALALALDRNPAAMARPPRPRDEPLLDRPTAGFILCAGGAKAFLGVVLLFSLPGLGEASDAVRTRSSSSWRQGRSSASMPPADRTASCRPTGPCTSGAWACENYWMYLAKRKLIDYTSEGGLHGNRVRVGKEKERHHEARSSHRRSSLLRRQLPELLVLVGTGAG